MGFCCFKEGPELLDVSVGTQKYILVVALEYHGGLCSRPTLCYVFTLKYDLLNEMICKTANKSAQVFHFPQKHVPFPPDSYYGSDSRTMYFGL